MSAAIVGLLVALVSLGCDRGDVESWLSGNESERPEEPDLFGPGAIEEVRTAFTERLGDEISALSLLVYADHAVLQAVNPRDPKAVDQWVYRDGKVSDPIPVRLMGRGKIEDNAFLLNDVRLEKIPELVQLARRRIEIPEGVISRVLVRRNLPDSIDVRIRVFVTSQRRDGTLDADAKGQPLGKAEGPR